VHHRGTFDETLLRPDPALAGRSSGFRLAPIVDGATGSRHQRVAVAELGPGGRVERHFHSYEEAVYILSGRVTLSGGDGEQALGADDFAFFAAGTPHAWMNAGSAPARWLEVSAPQPKPAGSDFRDTFFGSTPQGKGSAARVGHFDARRLPPLVLAGFSAVNISGASLAMLVDPALGAAHLVMFVVQFEPGGLITEHDHAFEEAYFYVEGEIESVAEGQSYTLGAGDYFWTSVGCPHSFVNRGAGVVRWIESQAPQPPSREAGRFKADWPGA
jgi:quercetin dioxygenase-like cupin family protein